jgi:hypothetical protein
MKVSPILSFSSFLPSLSVISDGSIEVLSRPPTDPVQAGEGGGDDSTTGSSSSIGAATPPPSSTQPLDDMSNDDASCAALMASDSTTTLQGSSSSSSMLNSFHSADPGAAAAARCVVRESVSPFARTVFSPCHIMYRVPGFLPSPFPPPPSHPQGSFAPPPLLVQGGRLTRLRGRGGGEGPNSDEETDTLVLNVRSGSSIFSNCGSRSGSMSLL